MKDNETHDPETAKTRTIQTEQATGSRARSRPSEEEIMAQERRRRPDSPANAAQVKTTPAPGPSAAVGSFLGGGAWVCG